MRGGRVRWKEGDVEVAALVLDLDGVLVDSLDAWLLAEQAAVRLLGGRWRRARPLPPGMDPGASLAERCGLDGRDEELVHAVSAAFVELMPIAVNAMEREVAAVRILSTRVPIAIATNTALPIAEALIALAGLHTFTEGIVSAGDGIAPKPAPDTFRHASKLLRCEPAACLGVDDTFDGVCAAASAGLVALAFGEKGGRAPGVRGMIHHLDELL